MRRLLSLATAVTLTSTVLAVPGIAHASIALTRLNTHFDNLAADRVATVTVAARSEAGVKEIRAELRHLSSANAPYATLTGFTRSAGTDEDGVWQIAYRPDIETRPGVTYVKVIVTGQDGTTTSASSGFRDCYATDFADLTAQPAVLDVDHQSTTVRGRLVFRKSRAEEPQPVPSARVTSLGAVSETTTGSDGGLALTTRWVDDAGLSFPAAGPLCSWTERAPVTVVQQATEVKAQLATLQPVPSGTVAVITGRVTRQAATGVVPAREVDVSLRFVDRTGNIANTIVSTLPDGTFRGTFTPRDSGRWSAWVDDSRFYRQSAEVGGELVTGRRTAQITGSNAGPEPLVRGEDVTITGDLKQVGGGPIENAVLDVEFSADGKTGWKKLSQARSYRGGKIIGDVTNIRSSGYWRLRFPGDAQNTPAVGWADQIEVRDRTYIYGFNASPEPVRKGGTVTVKGELHRLTGKPTGGFASQKVYFYFLPKGTKTWTYLASTTTDRYGNFSRGFKAAKDGTWRAYYAGSSAYMKWHADDYVDVR
ncbi:hypothetical protein [Actinomadura hibisca]|uniref:hypothetical protein n=1 Tax=Actinomadura hibisca TaxID=68565 RepID=UPI00082CB9F4|nr:hypothetical protein [Actinomadura hibisca]